jgi:hypothetical protein
MGDRDLIKPLLERRGEVHFGRVLMKPGKPLTFATLPSAKEEGRTMLVFGLPGGMTAAAVRGSTDAQHRVLGTAAATFVCVRIRSVPSLVAATLSPQFPVCGQPPDHLCVLAAMQLVVAVCICKPSLHACSTLVLHALPLYACHPAGNPASSCVCASTWCPLPAHLLTCIRPCICVWVAPEPAAPRFESQATL